jgi:hypothetical protein
MQAGKIDLRQGMGAVVKTIVILSRASQISRLAFIFHQGRTDEPSGYAT